MLPIASGARTDVGRVREHNEDSLLVGRRVWAVADGMGGHAAGDVASAVVIDHLARLDAQEVVRQGDLTRTLADANAAILRHGAEHPETRGLGSTVTGVACVDVGGAPHWAIFNIGDSRVYRLMDGQLARATVDHSETEELVLGGIISAEEARTHLARNVITRSLGQADTPQADVWVLPQTPGERFLVCSDGLTGEVTDADIATLLNGEPDAARAADLLVGAALEAGGRDNVTAIVLNVEGGAVWPVDENTNPRPQKEGA